jgi:hypothetical protein
MFHSLASSLYNIRPNKNDMGIAIEFTHVINTVYNICDEYMKIYNDNPDEFIMTANHVIDMFTENGDDLKVVASLLSPTECYIDDIIYGPLQKLRTMVTDIFYNYFLELEQS